MATFSRNADGSTIVTLDNPIKHGGDELSRVTLRTIRGKDMMHAPFIAGSSSVTVGQLVTFAAHLVEPRGALDEMDAEDALAIGMEVGMSLGKRPRTGKSASQS